MYNQKYSSYHERRMVSSILGIRIKGNRAEKEMEKRKKESVQKEPAFSHKIHHNLYRDKDIKSFIPL